MTELFKIATNAGAYGAFVVLGVAAIVVLWRYVLRGLLESVITITGNVRETMVATSQTAQCNREHGETLLASLKLQTEHMADLKAMVSTRRSGGGGERS